MLLSISASDNSVGNAITTNESYADLHSFIQKLVTASCN